MAYQFTQTGAEIQDILDLAQLQIAAPYDSASSYTAGDYCTYGDGFYVCTASTSGTWDGSKWSAVTVGDVLETANANISSLNATLTPQTVSVTIGTSSSIGASTSINVYQIGRMVIFTGSAYVSNLSANTSLALASGFPAPMTSFVYTGSGGYSANVATAYYINSAGNMTFRSHTAVTTEQEFYISGAYVTAS